MAGSSNGRSGSSNKRQRELARAKYERTAARKQATSAAQKRKKALWGSLGIMTALIVGISLFLWPESEDTNTTAEPSASAEPSGSASASSGIQPVAGCKAAPKERPDNMSWKSNPAKDLKPGQDYTLTLTTNCGDITIETLPADTPTTTATMLTLASLKYFDSTVCHRLTTGGLAVLQCGRPKGSEKAPGFEFNDELDLAKKQGDTYARGTVAMANRGPNTNGSQFFIVYGDSKLPPNYTVWGKVTKGLDIVDKVAKAGVAGGGSDGAPAQPIGIVAAKVAPALP